MPFPSQTIMKVTVKIIIIIVYCTPTFTKINLDDPSLVLINSKRRDGEAQTDREAAHANLTTLHTVHHHKKYVFVQRILQKK